ncbi:MAG: helix-turn-helix domain-containing protein, partial [Aggregatilineales bacterium]
TTTEKSHESVTFWHADDHHQFQSLYAHYIQHTFAKHFHDTYAIGVIVHGRYEFFHISGVQHISNGEIVTINPGEVHSGHTLDNHGWEYRMIYPGLTLMRQIAEEVTLSKWELPWFKNPVTHDAEVARLFVQYHHLMQRDEDHLMQDTLLRLALGRLILRHAVNQQKKLPDITSKRSVVLVRDYLEAHYMENVRLDDLAAEAHLSPYHLLRVFQRETGLSPHKYLTNIRIQKARTFLESGMSPIEVATLTGFTDQSHLTRWFKRIVGITPGRYI